MSLLRQPLPRVVFPAAAALALLLGFADLARGGTTISAVLLSAGYCVFIPLALWKGGGEPARAAGRRQIRENDRPSYLAAAIVATLVFVLYLITLSPSTAMWDTSEYITAAYTFGIPHPPGNPFFVIIGRLFSILPIASGIARRINILAALSSAAAAGMWFLITERVLAGWVTERWQRITGGVVATIIGATAFTVWNQSVVNEKVYTVSLVGIAIVSWLAILWSDDPDAPKADRLLIIIAYLCGLGYANHMAGMLPAPALILAVLLTRPSTVFRGKLLAVCFGALLLGMTPFATQPIRAAYNPPINEGSPTACRTTLEFSCTFSQGTYDAFMSNFNRSQYGKPELSDRQAPLSAQVGLWWFYFKWQWLRDPNGVTPTLQTMLSAAFLLLGLFGGVVHWKRDRRSFAYFGALMFTMTLALIYYLNFKYGYSQAPLLGDSVDREVRDRDYFFLWSFSAWGIWAALGLMAIWEAFTGPSASRAAGKQQTVTRPTSRQWAMTSPILALALVPLIGNWRAASRAGHHDTADFAADLLNSVEPYGVLVTGGDNDTFPLWYAQEVEGIRRDVVVANTSLLNTDWYPRQLIMRPVYEYDAAKGPAVYRGIAWKKPGGPPLKMSLAGADSVEVGYSLPSPVPFNVGPLHATLDARKMPTGILQRADYFVLQMIRDSWPDRPIFFARPSPYPGYIGLDQHVIGDGLAAKLFVPGDSRTSTKDTVRVDAEGWLDVPRTLALWNDAFVGPRAIIEKGSWVDRASLHIPYLYLLTGIELSEALKRQGQDSMSVHVFATTKQLALAVGLTSFIQGAEAMLAKPIVPPRPETVPGKPARGGR